MTLTDDQLTEAIASSGATAAAPPAWADVVEVGRHQRRARIGTAMLVSLVTAGALLAAVFIRSGDRAPLETTAPDHEIVLGIEDPTDRPVDPAELSGTQWRIAGEWNGDEESLRAVIRFDDVADGPSRGVAIDLSCNSSFYELDWDGWTFTSSAVEQEGALLCFDPDRDIDRYWRSSSTFVARFSGNTLIIEREEEELRLVQTAFGRPNRPDAAVQDALLDPELIFGDWRIIDLGPDGGLIDQTGRADDIRISLTRDEVVVRHACRSLAFDAEWTAGSLWTQRRPDDPALLIGCRSHAGLLRLADFLDRSGRIATHLVDGQLELARSPGTERIRAMSVSAG